MARAGRKRKPGTRERNGRLKRPTLAEMIAREQEARDIEKVTVLAQPHRRGDTDPWCASALGRFCIAYRLRRECYDAGLIYASMKSKWLAAVGAPRDVRMGGSGRDIPAKIVHGWAARIAAMEDAMMRAGGVAGLGWIEELAVYDRGEIGAYAAPVAQRTIMALAVECGNLPATALTNRVA